MDNGTWIGVGVLGTLAVGVGAVALVRNRATVTGTTGTSQLDTSTSTTAEAHPTAEAQPTAHVTHTSTTAKAHPSTKARTTAHVTRTPYHTVIRSGDTLSGIAFADGTTVDELVRLNAIADPNAIPIGTRIYLPHAMPAANLGINHTTVTCRDVRETIGDRLAVFRVCSDGSRTLVYAGSPTRSGGAKKTKTSGQDPVYNARFPPYQGQG